MAPTIPGVHMTIPPGGIEDGHGGWWVDWLHHTTASTAVGAEAYWFFSFIFDADSAWPVNNFDPIFNLHVTGSSPAAAGIASSPIQIDISGGTIKVYTHGGGVFNPNQYGTGVPGYHDVTVTGPPGTVGIPNGTPGSHEVPIARNIRYDVSLHALIAVDSAVGFLECWVAPRDGSVTEPILVASLHTSTMYSSDPSGLELYYGFYTRGVPGENPQPNNDACTFKQTAWLPRKGATIAAAQANTPVLTGSHGPLQFNPDINTTATPLDGTDFMYPITWGVPSGGGGGTGGGGGGGGGGGTGGGGGGGGTGGGNATGSQFGNSVKGSLTPNGIAASFVYGSSYLMSEDGAVTNLVAYLKGRGAVQQVFRPVIYTDAAGTPNTLVAAGPPVVVAPTDDSWRNLPITIVNGGNFGKTAVGGTTYLDDIVDIEVQGPYTLASSGTMTSMVVRVGGYAGHPNCKMRLIVYSDLAGAPSSLIGVTAEKTILSTDAVGNVTFTFPTPIPVVLGQVCWVGFWTNGNVNLIGDAAAPGSTFNLSQAYSSTIDPPNPWTNAGTFGSSGHEYTLYAVYDKNIDLTSGIYWLCLWSGITDSGADSYYDTAAPDDGFFCSVPYSATADPGSIAGFTYENHRNSIYALYNPVTPTAPNNTVLPVVTGSPVVGSTLTGTNGTWTGAPTFAYQWTRDGVNIATATNTTYVLVDADDGHSIYFHVVGSNLSGFDGATSLGTAVVTQPVPVNITLPVVSGVAQLGSVLSVSTGTWQHMANGTFTYKWQRDGVDIVGAISSSYIVVAADVGHSLRAVVTAHNSGTS